MSRSKNKNFVSPNCCIGDSQSSWKRAYNRVFRRNSKIHLDTSIDENGEEIKDYFHRDLKKRGYADLYSSPSDGFHRIEKLSIGEWNSLVSPGGSQYYAKYFKDNNIHSYNDYLDYFKKTYQSK